METIKFAKTRNVLSPTRGTSASAGIDFYIPYDLTLKELSAIQPIKGMVQAVVDGPFGKISRYILEPHRRILIPSGIKMKIPKGYAGLFVDKSGVSSKSGLTLLAKLIDEDYQGEIHINVVNTSDNIVEFYPGQQLAQLILIPVLTLSVEETTQDQLWIESTERGEGGFGSTNKQLNNIQSTENNEETSSITKNPLEIKKSRGRPRKNK